MIYTLKKTTFYTFFLKTQELYLCPFSIWMWTAPLQPIPTLMDGFHSLNTNCNFLKNSVVNNQMVVIVFFLCVGMPLLKGFTR